jgi:hypothetical protein
MADICENREEYERKRGLKKFNQKVAGMHHEGRPKLDRIRKKYQKNTPQIECEKIAKGSEAPTAMEERFAHECPGGLGSNILID